MALWRRAVTKVGHMKTFSAVFFALLAAVAILYGIILWNQWTKAKADEHQMRAIMEGDIIFAGRACNDKNLESRRATEQILQREEEKIRTTLGDDAALGFENQLRAKGCFQEEKKSGAD
jgi:hypothetical protein